MFNYKKKLSLIPKKCGVYLFYDKNDNIIYIGKALNLFNRVKSYFQKNNDIKTKILVSKINKIDYFITNNEVEALILEDNLIKKHQPKYNIKSKDSKSFPLIKITNEDIPKVIKCREKKNTHDEYYGPFLNIKIIKSLQNIFKFILKIRSCHKKFKPPYNYKPCLNYYINCCSSPCSGKITIEEYNKNIDIARNILKGDTKQIIELLTNKMNQYSENQQYEEAAKIRDQIFSIKELNNEQIIELSNTNNNDYIAIYNDFNIASISIIQQRDGKISGKENFIITNIIDWENILSNFLNSYYLNITKFPNNIYVENYYDDFELLKKAITQKFNIQINILIPQNQIDKKILKLAKENAEIFFYEKQKSIDKIHILKEMKKILNLETIPKNIECFDIATLDGKYNTASMVSFINGKPNKKDYRQFNITGEGHPDDYKMMEEIIGRRYQRLKNENKKLPDLIIIDGGKGQVNKAKKILDILNLKIPIIGIAKKFEHIYSPDKKEPLILDKRSETLKLIQNIRDEAHRFSNIRLSKRYKNDTLKSELLKIENIGKNRVNILLKKFKSIERIKKATIEELANTEKIGKIIAKKIYDYFNSNSTKKS